MKNKIISIITFFFVFACTGLVSFSQTKVDTVYIKYLSSTVNTSKDSASYYRVRTINGNIFQATDFDMKDSSIECSGYYKNFNSYIRNGFFIFYSPLLYGGFPASRSEGNYLNDEKDGVWKSYYPSGELFCSETYIKGDQIGLLQGYYKTGEIRRIETYEDGKRISGNCYTRSGKDTVYYEMSTGPSFLGGDKAMSEYLQSQLQYPRQAQLEKIQGTVFVKFSINTDGSITDVEVIKGRGVHPLLDNEAVRCVKTLQKWKPGTLEGEAIKKVVITRIKFALN